MTHLYESVTINVTNTLLGECIIMERYTQDLSLLVKQIQLLEEQQQQQKQEQKQQQQPKMQQEQIEQILKALEQDERDVQERRKIQMGQRSKTDKEW